MSPTFPVSEGVTMFDEPRAVLDIWLRNKVGSAEPMDRWAALVAILCSAFMIFGCLGAIAFGLWVRSYDPGTLITKWAASATWYAIGLIAAVIIFVIKVCRAYLKIRRELRMNRGNRA